MVMRILICGDSYALPDPNYPGMHWSEKIKDMLPEVETFNLARGGASNGLIALQLFQGLQFDPNLVILNFTENSRTEFDHVTTCPAPAHDSNKIQEFNHSRYHTSVNDRDNRDQTKLWFRYLDEAASKDMEDIKHYFYILGCLTLLDKLNKNFCFTLGGSKYHSKYHDPGQGIAAVKSLLKRHSAENFFDLYTDKCLSTNLWDYPQHPPIMSPTFHVPDHGIQQQFAEECIKHIKGKNCGNT